MAKKRKNPFAAKKPKAIAVNTENSLDENSQSEEVAENPNQEMVSEVETETPFENKSLTIKKETFWKYSTFILAALVIVLAFMLFSKDGQTTTGLAIDAGQQAAQPGNARVSADDDPFLGPEDAPITVIEFSDFECPFCGAAAGTHQQLVQQFKSRDSSWEAAVPRLKELAEQGKIKFVYRDYPLQGHSHAQKAAEAAECADEQGKFWEYHDKLFENQQALDVNSLKTYASQLGLDIEKFNRCLDSGQMTAEVQKDFADGNAVGVGGTPAFFINGQLVEGAQPFKAFEQYLR